MTELVRFRCLNCGKRFEETVLEAHEKQEAKRLNHQLIMLHCPECNRTDLRRGWE